MTLVVDTGPLVALADRRDRRQSDVERILSEEQGDLIVPLPVATETDYLLGRRGGRRARLAFLEDLSSGRFLLAGLGQEDIFTIQGLEERYADLDPGLADLSVVIVAARHGTARVTTFDDHFRILRPIDDSPAFDIVP